MTHVNNIIIDCVDSFAPKKQVAAFEIQGNWINYQLKNAMVRRNGLFQRRILQPIEENKNRYRPFRSKVTHLISYAKQSTLDKILGENPTSGSVYKSLKALRKKSTDLTLPDPE